MGPYLTVPKKEKESVDGENIRVITFIEKDVKINILFIA